MKTMRNLLVLCAVVAVAAGCKKKEEKKETPPPPPPPTATADAAAAEPAGPDPKVVARGEYLAKAGACLVCHTAIGPQGPDLANVGAGGLEMKEKFGVWRSPNITPDKGTGIGNWTDDQIAAAIREGLRPDGAKLSPMMPYMNYNGMTDDDVKAVVTFLRTLKPIEKQVAKSELKMEGIQAPKPPNQSPGDDPAKQGAYMASIMLCSHCHWTPNKQFTAPAGPDKMFSGGLPMELPPLGTGTLYTANITSDPDTGIGKWTEEQILASIKTMQKPDGKMIQGPMLFMQGAWSQLEDKDLHNVAGFIKALPAVKNKVPKSTFKPHAGGPPGAGGPGAGGPPGAGGAASGPGAAGGSGAGSASGSGAAPATKAGSATGGPPGGGPAGGSPRPKGAPTPGTK
jgi:cytochrome c553